MSKICFVLLTFFLSTGCDALVTLAPNGISNPVMDMAEIDMDICSTDLLLNIDNDNCGSCGKRCELGTACKGGRCVMPCDFGETLCDNGNCYNLSNDSLHCGDCRMQCPTGVSCTNGQCGLNCTGGSQRCGSKCHFVMSDNSACGSMCMQCSGGKLCVNGTCTCPQSLPKECSSVCVNLANDPRNCGGCGTACMGSDSVLKLCIKGTCSTQECPDRFADCNLDPSDGCEQSIPINGSCPSP